MNWLASLNLRERQQLGLSELGARATSRYQRWRKQAPFEQTLWWQARLALDGFDDQQFQALLDPAVVVATPPWAATLAAWREWQARPHPRWLNQPNLGYPLWPIVDYCLAQIEQALQQTQVKHAWPSLQAAIGKALVQRLAQLTAQTMVLELNVARLRGQLQGATSQARFEYFIKRYSQIGDLLDLLADYPLLLRSLVHECQTTINFISQIAQHLAHDWLQIQQHFGLELAEWIGLESLGDRHAGKSVCRLDFASGQHLAYKPRSLSTEVAFNQVLAWHNQQPQTIQLRGLKVLDCGNYGWTEWLQALPCADSAAVRRFYQRHGALLALLLVLQACDVHYENVIAVGEYPVLIDLEGLCHPLLLSSTNELIEAEQVGLLPRLHFATEQHPGVDMSGIAGNADQTLPLPQPVWDETNTDQMALRYAPTAVPAAHNLPTCSKLQIDPLDYAAEVEQGFRTTYLTLLSAKAELLSNILAVCADTTIRVIARPSNSYAILLRHASHPNRLRDALDRDCLFDHLWLSIPERPHLKPFLQTEQAALWQADIPWFGTTPRSQTIWDANGETLPIELAQSSWQRVELAVERLSLEDCASQIAQIRHAFGTNASPKSPQQP
ncbi:type 2 lanthipeptide synthetase LanM [Herpetosiphon gulosus]|uniref:Lantibiotic biosynthesis protein dehydration domain-containing protein n=1 Tax=Herpetosiphon gulosus TaxID=1973496 RepID=A0ABP9X1I1_9CHLR